MKYWKTPPLIKIYEALGAIGDKRITVQDNSAKLYSSSGNKYYSISYDSKSRAIMCNDNGSYWKGYLGYPAIAFLMLNNILPLKQEYTKALKNIPWKDINVKNKNNWDKTILEVNNIVKNRNGNPTSLARFANDVVKEITNHPFGFLGNKQKPPSGY